MKKRKDKRRWIVDKHIRPATEKKRKKGEEKKEKKMEGGADSITQVAETTPPWGTANVFTLASLGSESPLGKKKALGTLTHNSLLPVNTLPDENETSRLALAHHLRVCCSTGTEMLPLDWDRSGLLGWSAAESFVVWN